MKSTINTYADQWKFIQPVWRICVAVLVAQLVGAGFGLVIRPLGLAFLDLWYGGAYATPIGFIAGIAWQTTLAPGSLAQHRLALLFLGALSFLLPLFAYFTKDIWSQGFVQ